MLRRLLFTAAFLLFSGSSLVLADTVQLSGTTPDGGAIPAEVVNGTTYELSPYGGTLNGQAVTFICIDVLTGVGATSSWQANPTPVTNTTDPYTGTIQAGLVSDPGTVYLELAWLANKLLNDLAAGNIGGTATADQFAIWSFTGGPDPFGGAGSDCTNAPNSVECLDSEALTAVEAGYTAPGWVIESPAAGNTGQEMLVAPVAEPSSLLLLGAGVLACLAVRRRLLVA